ncbi:hypothetical protein NP493_1354g00061 [Ridgeia piscesae]|uniref:Uncharacterized protein n=1 Tax=Ridgeia piscesae TaxID=27915 RepID=A0AAD9K7V3_RIDPI|nr:hypothetical protein NP493_1354g00061 [Ridgeia piscesae]
MDSAVAQRKEKENSTPDEEWAALQQVVHNRAESYLGKPDRKQQIHHCSIQRCLHTATKTKPCKSDWCEMKAVEL